MPNLSQIATQVAPVFQAETVVSSWGCWLTISRRGGWVALTPPSQVYSELGPMVQVVVLGK